MMRMPPMVMDEVILLVDTYFKVSATNDRRLQQLYKEELSTTLRGLPFFPEFKADPIFRNVAGMNLLLMNIDKVVRGELNRVKVSKLTLAILDRYQKDEYLLSVVSQAVKWISTIFSPRYKDEYEKFLGGSLVLGYHHKIENSDQAQKIKENRLKDNKLCSLCQDDLSITYGAAVDHLMDLHFAAPADWYTRYNVVAAHQFLLLCPNCHRFAHSDIMYFSEIGLRNSLLV